MSVEKLSAEEVHSKVKESKGTIVGLKKETVSNIRLSMLSEMKAKVQLWDSLRQGEPDRAAIDLTLGEFVQEQWGFSPDDNGAPDSFYQALGIKTGQHTIEKLFNMTDPDDGFRWIIPEVIREAIRLGLRDAPIYPNFTAIDETVAQPKVTVPKIDKSNANATVIGEGEDPDMGFITFGQRDVQLHKVGVGIKITDEVLQYVALNILSIHLQDIGINMGLSMDTLAIDILLNGDQADGSQSSPEIGVQTQTQFNYRDFLHPWFRLGRLGRMPNQILSGEDEGIEIVELPEFKALAGNATLKTISIKTPIPTAQDLRIHGAMPANKFMLIDGSSALMKMTSAALRVENERIVMKQINGTMITTTTGFANLFRDARILVNHGTTFAGFPAYMDVDNAQNLSIF